MSVLRRKIRVEEPGYDFRVGGVVAVNVGDDRVLMVVAAIEPDVDGEWTVLDESHPEDGAEWQAWPRYAIVSLVASR